MYRGKGRWGCILEEVFGLIMVLFCFLCVKNGVYEKFSMGRI